MKPMTNKNRRLIVTPVLACLAWLCLFGMAICAAADEVVLQDKKLLVAFDKDSGALTRLKSTHWSLERHSGPGSFFRMHVLFPDHRDELIQGQKQYAADVEKLTDQQVKIRWENPTDEQGEVLPITFTVIATLRDGSLTFAGTVSNDSPWMVKSVDYPCLNDITPPGRNSRLWSEHMWYGDLKSGAIAPAAATIQSRQSLFCLIQSVEEGLYVEMEDPTQPYLLEFGFAQHLDAVTGAGGPDGGTGTRQEFFTTHFAYVHPNSTVKLAPVVMSFYRGDWHAGVDLYKGWRATWFKPPRIPDWIKDVNSWQQLQINTPEQDYRVPYTNLVQYGEECASNGVGAIQLVGWNHGGQDGGDPAQDPDPGLGTWQQLHDAIAQIRAKGVKIILFAKLNWADLTTAWYTNELCKYECTDPEGKRYEQGGYSYLTPTQLAGINNHRRAVMDFQDPAYRAVATREFQKILALEPAGWLWDEVCHHAGVEYSFATTHGYTSPGYIYGGDLPLAAQLRAAADMTAPDFLFAGEGPEDWLMQYFPCSYFRINNDSVPVCRYIDPQAPLMVAVTGFDDREMLNLILMDRYIISYEPYNFKGHLGDYPLTLAYGEKIDALRRKYKAYLWDAEFRDTLGAEVNADGAFHYSVFVTATGKRAVVVVNQEYRRAITATVKLSGSLPDSGRLLVATPENPETNPTDGVVNIPARSAAVVIEP